MKYVLIYIQIFININSNLKRNIGCTEFQNKIISFE